jgi:ubiquinone/menaquinone biosynthesis C-methylase UbiE
LVEFTGERVVPGQVNDDLWSEHLARYAFARLYAEGRNVLDAGCGTGYGSSELASVAAHVTGFDVAPEAIEYARAHYESPAVHFALSLSGALPFAANAFDLVVAFEVIEHLTDHRAFLQECARVLKHQGLLIVSSPNRSYYAESRAETGPNPYHQHEFEAAEFVAELQNIFSNVRLLLQNRVESFAFQADTGRAPAEARIDRGGSASEAHFLIGLCSFGPLPEPRSFVYLPTAANQLREREHHIELLERDLAATQSDRDSLLALHRDLQKHLDASNRWAASLGVELEAAGQRVVDLQNELQTLAAGYREKVLELEEENRLKTVWALETEERLSQDLLATADQLAAKCNELAECVRLLEAAEATVVDRTLWAQRLEAQRAELAAKLNLVRTSRWVKLGRKINLGPGLE